MISAFGVFEPLHSKSLMPRMMLILLSGRTCTTVDGRNPAPLEVGSLSHYLQGFIHIPGGCLGFLNHQQVPSSISKCATVRCGEIVKKIGLLHSKTGPSFLDDQKLGCEEAILWLLKREGEKVKG